MVITEVVPDCSASTRQSMIRGKTSTESVIYADGPRGYHGLVDFGFKKHFRAHHGGNQFVRGQSHINGIESFWGFAKARLTKFRGLDKNKFVLHLKESEFRFNHRDKISIKSCSKNLKIIRLAGQQGPLSKSSKLEQQNRVIGC